MCFRLIKTPDHILAGCGAFRLLAQLPLQQGKPELALNTLPLRFQASTRQLADNSQIKKSRRRVALLKTLLHERRTAAE